MARRPTRAPGSGVARNPTDGALGRPLLRATSKNRQHPYSIEHPGPVSDDATWTVKDLCAAYDWPKPGGVSGGGTIAFVYPSGGWLQSDIDKFFAAQGFLADMAPTVSDHPVNDAPGNTRYKVPNQGDTEVALDVQLAGAAYGVATGQPATIRVYWAADLASGLRAATADECDVCCITWGADEKAGGDWPPMRSTPRRRRRSTAA